MMFEGNATPLDLRDIAVPMAGGSRNHCWYCQRDKENLCDEETLTGIPMNSSAWSLDCYHETVAASLLTTMPFVSIGSIKALLRADTLADSVDWGLLIWRSSR